MRILFTGASSFTGRWFVKALADAGHDVVCTMTRSSADDYAADERRHARVRDVETRARIAYGASFGDDAFLALLDEGPWDLLCHHAADVTDYKSPGFNVPRALAANTRNAAAVLAALRNQGAHHLLLTGSVFEGGEGAGSPDAGTPLPHFSPYGLSKALTGEAFRFECHRAGLAMGKLVIPNPFGPFEDPRFTAYLVRTWAKGDTPGVNTPDYVRDNIHAALLAECYARFAEDLLGHPAGSFTRLNPSGYIESQGAFALRFAREMEARLGRPCPVTLATQAEFPEPVIRVNTDPAARLVPDWDEARAWDELAEFYRPVFDA